MLHALVDTAVECTLFVDEMPANRLAMRTLLAFSVETKRARCLK